ncbi:apolipoprotein N-acyltransferase [Marisediminicola antarctica]|uniref:Apolipoprotein N-acyltransferase n=1 Tax=Marisediminicola antarctica TaxID=674079 RepID=A0A7L5AHU5_9MICO|nr:apolipoprotein N-acyltransferase [Marisediminicola antarctica]QHO70150.1 apolipoprotein N-acyltransferase [Marisediminicola antarctica]
MITRAAPSRPPRRSASGRAAPLWLAVVLAAFGGMLNALAFPGIGWWPLVFVGTPLILYSLVGRRVGPSLLVGLVGGLVFWGTHIFWITVYLGAAPWLALGGLQSVFFAIGCALIALAWRFGDRALPGPVGQLLVLPLLVAGLWTLREFVTTTWPYGGFSWGRLAFSQSESPFAELAAWVGVAGVSFLIAWVSALVVQAQRVPAATLASSAGPRRILRSVLPVGLLIAMLAVPAFPIAASGSLRVAAVQGDSDAGLFAEYEPGQILQDHLSATEPLYGEDIDLLVWPENASDLDPLRSPRSSAALDRVTEQAGAPLIVGTITADGDDIYNSLLLWQEGGDPADQYDKLHPVPFAEYIPDRDFWFPLAPDLLSLIPRDFSIGTRDNLFDIAGAATAGVAICFDIVDDNLVRQMIAGGADIIIAPTNNADFGHTDESVQQLAIARLRAIETGRSVVNASTVGTSAIIAPDGSTLERLPTFTPGTMLQDVPLSTTTTPATVLGQGIEIAVSVLALLGLITTGLLARTRRAGEGTTRG